MQDDGNVKCSCPPGFKGDGVKSCEGMNTEILHLVLKLWGNEIYTRAQVFAILNQEPL